MLDYYPRHEMPGCVYLHFLKNILPSGKKDDGENIKHMKYDSMKCTEFLSPLKHQEKIFFLEIQKTICRIVEQWDVLKSVLNHFQVSSNG